MKHLNPAEIEAHLERKNETAIDGHLESCDECALMARSIDAFRAPLTWEISALPEPDPMEDSVSSSAAEIVQKGIAEAESLRHVDPGRAVAICDRLLGRSACSSDTEEGRHLSVLVLRERANALRFMGELQSALDTISRARTLADELLVNEYENAVLDYIEATVFFEQDRLDDVIRLAGRAEATLRRFGDEDRARKGRFMAASVEFKRGNLTAARTSYLEILDSMMENENRAMKAGVLHNLAGLEVAMERYGEAAEHSSQAALLFRSLRMTTELTRLKWTDARMALATGDLETAESMLEETESEFAEAGLKLDAALVSLELVELLVRQGRQEQVVEITSRLASVFTEAGAQMGLATALATLREAAARGDDVSLPVARARTTIEELMAQG